MTANKNGRGLVGRRVSFLSQTWRVTQAGEYFLTIERPGRLGMIVRHAPKFSVRFLRGDFRDRAHEARLKRAA